MFSKDQILNLKTRLNIEVTLNCLVLIVIILTLIVSLYALFRPVDEHKIQQVTVLSKQAAYPKTQSFAKQIQKQEFVRTVDYLKLIRVYRYEKSHIKEYPATASE